MLGLHPLDIAVLLAYLFLILFIGLWASRRVKNTGDFFLAGRRLGKFMTAMLNFGTGTHSDQAVGVISKVYSDKSFAGIWYQWLWLLKTPFDWVMSAVWRRLRIVTTADYFRNRYDVSVATLYAFLAIVILMQNIGTMLLGSSRIVVGITGGQIPFGFSVIGMTVLFVVYGMAGGFTAAAYTDVIQGVLTIILSFLLLPFAIMRVGGFSGLHEKLPDHMFSLVDPKGEITIFFIFMVTLNGIINISVQPHQIPISVACKTEMESRVGVTYGILIKRICTVAWAFTGLCAIALFPSLDNPDHAFGEIAQLLLPAGLIGLLLASVIAAVQSSCDALMVTASGIFTRNVYRVFFEKDKSDRHYLLVGRISSLVVVAGGLSFAFFMSDVITALELFWKIPALMGIPFWMGIFWRRANPTSVWVSFIAATTVFLSCEMDLFIGYEVPLPWEMVAYLSAGLIGAIIGGLVTKPQPEEHLDLFYKNVNESVDKIEYLETDTM